MKRLYLIVAVLLLVSFALPMATPQTASAAPAGWSGGSGCAQFYWVRYGDNLFRIALRFGTSVPALMALNGIYNPNLIYVGMPLCVRTSGGGVGYFYYTVCWGDTLYSIAMRYGWSVNYLASYNHIPYPWWIYAGQSLKIPYH